MSMSALLWLILLLNGKFLVKELAFGQFNLPLGLLLLGAVIAVRHGRGLAAGGLTAAGVFIKPYALVLLPWLVWTQGWRPLMPFAIVVTAGLALPAVSYGWEGNIALLQGWYRTVTDTTAPNLLAHENISLASIWAKWLHPGPLASLLALGSAVATVGAGLFVIQRRAVVAEPNYLEGAYFFVLIPLLSPQGWDYLLLLAIPAYMCLVDRWRETSHAWRAVAMVGFILTSFVVYDPHAASAVLLPPGLGCRERRCRADCREPGPVAVPRARMNAIHPFHLSLSSGDILRGIHLPAAG